jgi:hypothetical protein
VCCGCDANDVPLVHNGCGYDVDSLVHIGGYGYDDDDDDDALVHNSYDCDVNDVSLVHNRGYGCDVNYVSLAHYGGYGYDDDFYDSFLLAIRITQIL